MWAYYNYAITSLVLMGIVAVVYCTRFRVRTLLSICFVFNLAVSMLCAALDIAADYTSALYGSIPDFVPVLFDQLYFAVLILQPYAFFLYAYTLSVKRKRLTGKLLAAFTVPLVLLEALCALTPVVHWLYSIDAGGLQNGPAYILMFVEGIFYICAALIVMHVQRAHVLRRERIGVYLYCVVLTVGYALGILLPNVLVIDGCTAIALLIMYLSLQNPEFYLFSSSGMYNRHGMGEVLSDALMRGRRVCIVGFSINNFDDMRELYGTAQLEASIELIYAYLAEEFPQLIACYLESGRFALICASKTPVTAQESSEVVKRLRERFSKPWISEHADTFFSIQTVQMPEMPQLANGEAIIAALTSVMMRMQREAGTEDLVVTDAVLEENERRHSIEAELKGALDSKSLQVYLQPIYSTKRKRVTRAEALARIVTADGTVLPPAEFIGIAESTGTVIELGEQVFERTCQIVRDYDLPSRGIESVNVNLSPIQCLSPTLPARFAQIAARYGVPLSLFTLEITEESFVDINVLRTQMERFIGLGAHFSLDDYGTGYSNLHRIVQLPFANIKIDRLFILEYEQKQDNLLPMIVRMLKQQGYSVTAEGVEDARMLEVLTRLGSDYVQGFYFSCPVPPERFAAYVDAEHARLRDAERQD